MFDITKTDDVWMAKETILRNADLITSWFCNSSSKSARKNVASSIAPNASTSSETPDDENDDCDYTDYTISIYPNPNPNPNGCAFCQSKKNKTIFYYNKK